MGETTKTKKNSSAGKRVLDVILSLALLAGVGYGGYCVATKGTVIDQNTNYTDNIIESEETTPPIDENKIIFESQEISNDMVYNGSLILVNNNTAFQGAEDDIISLYELMLEKGTTHSFGVRDAEVKVRQENAENLIAMFEDFYSQVYDNNIVVQSGYRSKERQQELYDEDLASTGLDYSEKVSKAGYSEHQTGWSVDLTLADGEYDGTGVYNWINEHCFEYGMILRYAEDKTDITGIAYEPWHYRYVGKGHAYYIMQNHLCLEEYLDFLHQYVYDGEHLRMTDYDGKVYEIFFYPADTANATTMLPVPSGLNYSVSGNNTDGFIVTVDTGEFAEVSEESVPENAEENLEESSENLENSENEE
ncbi:MAG: M15 family metallopeptidase [Oscillospiraceae bacterium]|nr:M15 family metallopeptidase [Oscillospiraceae bacterium]